LRKGAKKMIEKERIQAILDKYVPILKLNNWKIRFEIVSEEFLTEFGTIDKPVLGATVKDSSKQEAVIYIYKEADQNNSGYTLEEIILDQLLFIVFSPLKRLYSNLLEELKNKGLDSTSYLNNYNWYDQIMSSIIRQFTDLLIRCAQVEKDKDEIDKQEMNDINNQRIGKVAIAFWKSELQRNNILNPDTIKTESIRLVKLPEMISLGVNEKELQQIMHYFAQQILHRMLKELKLKDK